MSSAADHNKTLEDALELYHQRKYQEALDMLRPLLYQEDLDVELKVRVLRTVGWCVTEVQSPANAIEYYDQALAACPEESYLFKWILESKANALTLLHQYDEAVQLFNKVLGMVTDSDDVEHIQEQIEMAMDEMKEYNELQIVKEKVQKLQEENKQKLAAIRDQEQLEQEKALFESKPKLEA